MAKEQEQTQPQAGQEETVTAPEGQQQQTQLQLDESQAQTFYSSTSRIWGSAEELIVDFSQGVRPSGKPNTAVLKIDSRIIMSPWAAKRLALALSQSVQRYEQTYGTLEIDPRKRQKGGEGGATTSTS